MASSQHLAQTSVLVLLQAGVVTRIVARVLCRATTCSPFSSQGTRTHSRYSHVLEALQRHLWTRTTSHSSHLLSFAISRRQRHGRPLTRFKMVLRQVSHLQFDVHLLAVELASPIALRSSLDHCRQSPPKLRARSPLSVATLHMEA